MGKTVRHDDHGRECSVCKEVRPWACFHKQSSGFKGRYHTCKKCRNQDQSKPNAMDGFTPNPFLTMKLR